MAGLLYYIPGHEGPLNIEHLRKAGIAYAFEDAKLQHGAISGEGPDGGAGALVCVAGVIDPAMMGVSKDGQTWQKIPGTECYVGMFNDDPPKPENCVCKKALPGHWIECEDGQEWLAPIGRGLSASEEASKPLEAYCALPRIMTIDDNGTWIQGEIVARYAAFWELAVSYWDALMGGIESAAEQDTHEVQFDFEGKADAAVLVLAINYRIGKAEVSLLRLFTNGRETGPVPDILGAMVDWPIVVEWLKKNRDIATDGSNTGDGPEV